MFSLGASEGRRSGGEEERGRTRGHGSRLVLRTGLWISHAAVSVDVKELKEHLYCLFNYRVYVKVLPPN